MKKKTLSLSKHFSSVVVYLDDIKDIIAIFQEYKDNIKISDDSNEYENLEELLSHVKRPKIKELSIGIYSPHIFIDIKRDWLFGSYISFDSDNDSDKGTYLRLKEKILSLKRWPSKIFNYYTGFIFFVLLVVLVPRLTHLVSKTTTYIGIASLFVLMLVSFFFGSGLTTQIWLKNKDDLPGFFSRNKDSLAIGSICAIIGALLGAIATLVFSKI